MFTKKDSWAAKGSLIALILIAAAFFIYCLTLIFTNQKETPTEAVSAFYENAEAGEVDKAEEYVAEEVKLAFQTGNGMFGTLSQGIIREAGLYESISPTEERINGKTAFVTVQAEYTDGTTGMETFTLIKESGSWKLLFQ